MSAATKDMRGDDLDQLILELITGHYRQLTREGKDPKLALVLARRKNRKKRKIKKHGKKHD